MKKTGARLLLATTLALVLLLATGLVAFADGPESGDGTPPGEPIVLGVEYDWDPPGDPGTSTWGLYRDGTFIDGFGDTGRWRIRGRLLVFVYEVGCQPVYVGRLQYRWYWEGRMRCRDGSGDRGTWAATYPANPTSNLSNEITISGETQ